MTLKKIPKSLSDQFHPQFLETGEKLWKYRKYQHFDFVRNSFCARFSDSRGAYWSFIKKKKNKNNFVFSCDCNTFLRHSSCQHVAALLFIIYEDIDAPQDIYDNISQKYYLSLWQILAKESFGFYEKSKINFKNKYDSVEKILTLNCYSEDEKLIFRFQLPQSYWGKIRTKYKYIVFDEKDEQFEKIIESAKYKKEGSVELLQPEKTDLEERMNLADYKSWRQKFEESIWFDISKIWFLTVDEESLKVEYHSKTKALEIFSSDHDFRFCVHGDQLAPVLNAISTKPFLKELIKFNDEKAYLNYSLQITNSFDLQITPVLKIGDQEPIQFRKRNTYKPAIFGKYMHLENLGFYPFEREITYFDARLFGLKEVIIPNEKIPELKQEYKKSINEDKFHYVSPSLLSENYVRTIDSAEVVVHKFDKDSCYVDIQYKSQKETLSFRDIYRSIQKGKRYLIGKKKWIDLHAPSFEWIHELESPKIFDDGNSDAGIILSKVNFLKMRSLLPKKNRIISKNGQNENALKNLLIYKPRTDMPSLEKSKYTLRDYQNNGYAWLWFLYENGLSGLLCDDMGLGKTYQSVALLDGITRIKDRAKFLIVCPTSVIPHWREKLGQFRKKVRLHVYYGPDRKLSRLANEKYTAILTSYGVMRNDLDILQQIDFEVMVFDEIQSAKNKSSLTNAALTQLKSRTKIGLTGTPIENDLTELKALFDIILPGYLGKDNTFKKKFIDPIEQYKDKKKIEHLYKIINPFTLRRTKSQVLEELPPKTEEIRTCELSEIQERLYRDVINSRALTLVKKLNNEKENIPYMHIFAVLNYLKQICNHPAQLENGALDYRKYRSGKWELFCELLEESLNSGFKVVVFSQYLNMLALIEKYLKDIDVEFATIKGSTRNRGEMIDRFNTDPKCMVFTGSLKASGLGINLVGGSVVIHYDRWWNAAREDQATDRVHRIGQTRGVQVFKLITEGTLEKKIDLLIEKKKSLMEHLVREDDAKMIKKFDREELIELLTF
ncbi:hypothetical protein GF337_04765 [candidate division KSB1 bacterium]|nr:hypothetical protein [candidate division KSB1 bacterium]